jgi:hypothetical protein
MGNLRFAGRESDGAAVRRRYGPSMRPAITVQTALAPETLTSRHSFHSWRGVVTPAAACWMYVGALAGGMRKISYAGYRFPPEVIHQSYGAVARDLGIEHLHERGRWKNNRAENSHQPVRRRKRKMQRFKNSGAPGTTRDKSGHAESANAKQMLAKQRMSGANPGQELTA